MEKSIKRVALGLSLAALAACTSTTENEHPWIDLFDGHSLSGWSTTGGRYDGDARWTVEDGAIVGRQGPEREGGLLYTDRMFDDVELELDVQIDHPFDSGVFLRMVPDERGAQVTLDHWPEREPKGEIGGIYSDGWLLHCPQGADRFRAGEWNHLRIECRGRDVAMRVYLNGDLLVDHPGTVFPPGEPTFAPKGRIGLQVHGGEEVPLETAVRFRNVRARELPMPQEPAFSADDAGFLRLTQRGMLEGWRPLFDGNTLEGWEPVGGAERCTAGGGVLTCAGGGGWLATEADFQDFELRVDFQCGRLSNSGVFLRAPRDAGDPAYSGCEIQVIDDFEWEQASGQALEPWQLTGSLYASVAPGDSKAVRPTGQWNTLEVRYQGTQIRAVLNGRELYDVSTRSIPADPPFLQRAAAGAIGLQCHGAARPDVEGRVAYRNLFVRTL